LERVTQLFEVASDGTDEASWARRFKDFTSKTVAKQKSSMPQADILSLKFELLTIVEERLTARCEKCNSELKDALMKFHEELRKLIGEALQFVGAASSTTLKMSPNSLDTTLNLDALDCDLPAQSGDEQVASISNSPFNGVASFVAAARKPVTEKSVHSDSFSVFHFDAIDDELDGSFNDDVLQQSSSIKPILQFGADCGEAKNEQITSKYTEIHSECKARLFNIFDIEKPEKVMTLGQLREVMTGCVQGKKEKDAHCRAANLPLLTMETYLFEFLEKRYNSGEETEIKEWFVALSKAINKFGVFDSEICIFGKMLRNVLPESFVDQQRVLRSTAEKKLKDDLVSSAWNARTYNGVQLQVFEQVVYNMFNQKDAADIMKRIRDPLPRVSKRGAANLEALSRDHVRYQHAMEVISTFNMNLQDDFLQDFNAVFRKVDAGKDGVLHTNELSDLVQRFGTVESVREGSSAYTLLVDARASTLRSLRRARRLTYSEVVDQFRDLLSARWSVTGKKGTRYQYHDALKASLAQSAVGEKQPEQAEPDKLKSALKKAALEQKLEQSESDKVKSSLKKNKQNKEAQVTY